MTRGVGLRQAVYDSRLMFPLQNLVYLESSSEQLSLKLRQVKRWKSWGYMPLSIVDLLAQVEQEESYGETKEASCKETMEATHSGGCSLK